MEVEGGGDRVLSGDAWKSFYEAIRGVLSQWTALQLAVHHSDDPAADRYPSVLFETITEWFFLGEIFPLELEELLVNFLNDELNTAAEDGSTSEVAELICSVYCECRDGKYDKAVELAQQQTSAPSVEQSLKSTISSRRQFVEEEDGWTTVQGPRRRRKDMEEDTQ